MFNKKFLYIGNNSIDTDNRASTLAKLFETTNNGLIDSADFVPKHTGIYHTSLTDLSYGDIIKLAKYFDQIELLDQPASEWSASKLLLSSYKLLKELESLGYTVIYKDNNNVKNFIEFENFLNSNKSFCIYPWINFVEDDGTMRTCARSAIPVTTVDQIVNWKTDSNYNEIRNKMLNGERLPNHCKLCYDYEAKGVESYRIFETKEWIAKLGINSIEDVKNIDKPYYYEMRLNNTCNLMCRSCVPKHSLPIEREYKEIGIIDQFPKPGIYTKLKHINIDELDSKSRVYLTGGEPTVMIDVFNFMEECITRNKTDFEFTLGTNASKISERFFSLAKKFSNLGFSVSLDGYGRINDYWRWGSDWDTIIKNMHRLKNQGHVLSINTVPGLYNVTNFHLLYEFLDREFPDISVYLQFNNIPMQSAFNHPNHELVLDSLEKCKKTKVYYSDGKSNKSGIDGMYNHYSKNPKCDLILLKEFFDFNDKLDKSRNVRLIDYIPELEECRKYVV